MDKKRMTQLIKLADEVLVSSGIKQQNSNDIKDSYNGQTAAFGIMVLMSGLVPALVIYYQDANENREINRRAILKAVGQMIGRDPKATAMIADRPMNQTIRDADTLLKAAIRCADDKTQLKQLSREVVECATALKQIIRTYNLV
jgi:hypothetical protein